MSMPEEFKDPTRTLLFSGVAAAAVLAAVGGFLFFANVPEPGAAAREQILAAASPKIERADIDRIVAARNAFAPRPTQTTKSALSDDAAKAGALVASPPEAAAAPVLSDWAAIAPSVSGAGDAALGNQGDDLFREGEYSEAMAYWRAQAESGDRWSAFRLGYEYLDGKPEVVKRDLAEGTRWIRFAAEHNEPHAQFELGQLYESGTGMVANLAQAASWYLKSAERGHVHGQYNVATMLEAGDGIAEDKIEALKFYTLAARQGFMSAPAGSEGRATEDPASAIMSLRSKLPPDAVREAERRAAAFKPIQD